MRIVLLSFILLTALCVEGQQRSLRRFSPSRSRQTVNAANVEEDEIKVEDVAPAAPAAPARSRSRQRNVLRPSPFSARFSGRAAKKDIPKEEEKEKEIDIKPTPAKKPARGQRRRPHFHKRVTTTVKPPTTIAKISEELPKERMPAGEETIIDMEKKEVSKKEMDKKEIIPIAKAEESIIKSKPALSPIIKHRPLTLRRPRIGSRNRGSPKPKENIAKVSEPTLEKPLKIEAEVVPVVDASPRIGSRHRFAGNTGLLGRRQRVPRIKAPTSDKNNEPQIKVEPDITIDIGQDDDMPIKTTQTREPAVRRENTRNISLENDPTLSDKSLESKGNNNTGSKQQTMKSILSSLTTDEDELAASDSTTTEAYANFVMDTTTDQSNLERTTGDTTSDPKYTSKYIITNHIDLVQPELYDRLSQASLEITTTPVPLDITTKKVHSDISVDVTHLNVSTENPTTDNSINLFPIERRLNDISIEGTTSNIMPDEVTTETIVKDTPTKVNTEIIPVEFSTESPSQITDGEYEYTDVIDYSNDYEYYEDILEDPITQEKIEYVNEPKITVIPRFRNTPSRPFRERTSEVQKSQIDTVQHTQDEIESVKEPKLSIISKLKNTPSHPVTERTPDRQTGLIGTVVNIPNEIEHAIEPKLSIIPRLRNAPLQLVRGRTPDRQSGLIGTVEDTPDEEVQQILSGLGSRRRGLSRY